MNKTTYLDLIRYINAGRLLHLIALLDLIISVLCIYNIVPLDVSERPGLISLWIVVLAMFGGMSIFAELDGYSRFQDYKRVKDQLYFYGYQNRIVRPMMRSRCQRDALQLACNEFNIGEKSRAQSLNMGYRWHHVFPDFVFSTPGYFFTSDFWRRTFFTPYYEAKVDYSLLDPAELNLSQKSLHIEKAA